MYVVINLTNYGDGFYFAGCYRTREKAEARLNWILKHIHVDEEEDSWRICYVEADKINEVPNGMLTNEDYDRVMSEWE